MEGELTADTVAPGIWLVCSELVIENEIAQGVRQKDVAMTYALALRSEAAGADKPDWKRINQAIIAKWGMKGLSRVKDRAWKLATGEIKPDDRAASDTRKAP